MSNLGSDEGDSKERTDRFPHTGPLRRAPAGAFLVIVRGPLGAGKSALSRRLAEELGGVVISIDQILMDRDLGRWGSVYITLDSFLTANRYAAEAVDRVLGNGRPAVVDGNFYWREAIDDLLRRIPCPSATLTLDVGLEECVARDALRVPSLGEEAARLVYAKVTSFDYGTRLDATPPLENVVQAALGLLRDAGLLHRPPGRERPRLPT